MKKIKALVLLSGGLDSILAAKILIEQKIGVTGLTFKSYFFGASQAEKAAKELKIPLKIIDFSKEHLKIVKNPKYGYGRGMNPCIDCHALMLREAKKIMMQEKFDPVKSPDGDHGASFVATGEVLGERPMSQNKQALKLIEKESGLQSYLLRPLSAKLLEETIPEKMGWVDREKLLAISGRSRKKQIELAKKIMMQEKFDPVKSPDGDHGASFVATGEVLGERPMSQNKQALKLIEKESGLQSYLLRPLSAKLLEETIPEKMGWVDREKLLAISGRSRKKQIELAKKWNIKEYPTPAGGCLLTDLEFSKKLKELLAQHPEVQKNDIEFLKIGRHSWIDKTKIIVGRNQEENIKIKKLAQKSDILIELQDISGPTTLVRNYGKDNICQLAIEKAKKLTKHYSTKARNKKQVEFNISKL